MVIIVVGFYDKIPNVFVQEFPGINFLDVRIVPQLDNMLRAQGLKKVS
jgi:hypothetical protein